MVSIADNLDVAGSLSDDKISKWPVLLIVSSKLDNGFNTHEAVTVLDA
jgi:hypothetical protein